MMKYLKLSFAILSVFSALLFFTCCGDDYDCPQIEVANFEVAPANSLIRTGSVTDFTIEDTQGQSLTKNPSKVSLKLAYAWFPFKSISLYLEPSMTFGVFINDEDLNFTSGEIFNKKSFIGNGPLFNMGYKFNF